MKKELKFRLIGLPFIFISMVYFGCYAVNDYKECNSMAIQADGTHYHNGIECRYEGLECPQLSQANADAQLRMNVINATDTTWFHNGEVLYPDYVHPDTMIVVNARYLNEEIILNKHGLIDGSDDSYWELLSEGCVNLEDYQDYLNVVKK